MPQQGDTPGAVVLGSDFKALGVIRSLGRRGIPGIVIDNLPRSAWFSRYVTRRFAWDGPMEGDAFLNFLLRIAKEHHLEKWVLFPLQDEVVEFVARNTEQLAKVYQLVTQDWEVIRWAHDKRLPTTWPKRSVFPILKPGIPPVKTFSRQWKSLFRLLSNRLSPYISSIDCASKPYL